MEAATVPNGRRIARRHAPIAIVALVVVATSAVPATAAWSTDQVTRVAPAHLPSLLLEATGGPGVGWQDSTATYWSRLKVSEGRWVRERIDRFGDSAQCRETSEDGLLMRYPWAGVPSARGSDGQPRVAFACETISFGWYFFARRTADGWKGTVVGDGCGSEGCEFATSIDLVLDGSTPVVIVAQRDGSVRSFTRIGTGWRKRVLVRPSAICCQHFFPAVNAAIEPTTGSLALAWVSDVGSGSVRYATYDDDGRRVAPVQIVTSPVGGTVVASAPSLSYLVDGTPIVAFTEGDADSTWLSVAVRTGDTWDVATVDDVSAGAGVSPALAVSGSTVRVLSGDQVNGTLRLATTTDLATWDLSTIDATFDPTYLTAAATRAGGLRAVAGRVGERALWYWSGP